MKKDFRRFSLLLSLIILALPAWTLEVPKLVGRVNDYAEILTPAQRDALEIKLKEFESSTSNQIVLLIIPSLEGEDDVAYGVKVFKAWQIGQEGKDNGVLWLHATKERKNRLEIGYGLEGALPDATCMSILTQNVAPLFKAGNFYDGYVSGIDRLIQASKGEYEANGNSINSKNAKYLLFLLPFILAVIAGAYKPLAGGIVGALVTGLIAYFMFSFFAIILATLIGFFIGLIAAPLLNGIAESEFGGSGGYGGGYGGGGDSGFSGGGGDSGGGGASAGY